MARNPPTPIDAVVGRRIATARKAAGLTLRELAAQLGWPHTTLGNYEVGRRSLTLDRLATIGVALRRAPASFLASTPEAATIIDTVDSDLERALQVQLMLDALMMPDTTWDRED